MLSYVLFFYPSPPPPRRISPSTPSSSDRTRRLFSYVQYSQTMPGARTSPWECHVKVTVTQNQRDSELRYLFTNCHLTPPLCNLRPEGLPSGPAILCFLSAPLFHRCFPRVDPTG
jgi:hypothetical protein